MMFNKHKKFIYVLPQKRRHNLLSKSFGRSKNFYFKNCFLNDKKYEFIIG